MELGRHNIHGQPRMLFSSGSGQGKDCRLNRTLGRDIQV